MKHDKLLFYLFLVAFLDHHRFCNVLEQLTNRIVPVKIFNCGVNIKTKDCARSRPFQHKLERRCFHGNVS